MLENSRGNEQQLEGQTRKETHRRSLGDSMAPIISLAMLLLQDYVAIASPLEDTRKGVRRESAIVVTVTTHIPSHERKDIFYRFIYEGYGFTSTPKYLLPSEGILLHSMLATTFASVDARHNIRIGRYHVSAGPGGVLTRIARLLKYGTCHITLSEHELRELIGSEKRNGLEKWEIQDHGFHYSDVIVSFPDNSELSSREPMLNWETPGYASWNNHPASAEMPLEMTITEELAKKLQVN